MSDIVSPSTAAAPHTYTPRRPPQSQWLSVRGWRYHLWSWGAPTEAQPAPWVLLHGWMDVGASFQFVVDALAQQGHTPWVVAPDWRGFGHTHPVAAAQAAPHGFPTPPTSATAWPDAFWWPDYLGDLDALLEHLSPARPVALVGHSMGGNVATVYAGVRPERVARLVNLEGFGLPATRPDQAPERLSQWLDGLHALHAGCKGLKPYPTAQAVAQRLMANNPRLSADKALWLAAQWAEEGPGGQWRLRAAPAHKLLSPLLYRVEEVLACWARIQAPVLAVEASHTDMARWWGDRYTLAEYHQRLQSVPRLQTATIADAGHMLHHDQPGATAALLAQWLAP